MRAHLAVVKSILEARGYQVFFADVPKEPTYPYVVLAASAGDETADSLGACDDVLRDRVYVTSVSLDGFAVLSMQDEVRKLLGPSMRRWKRLPVAGRAAYLRLFDSRPVDTDRQVTVLGADKHPMFGVDVFELDSQPV